MLTGLILAAVEGGTELAESASELQVESLIRDLAFILILGAAVTVLFKWIRQPVVLGYIVAGFLASPHFEYLPSVTTESNIDFWAQIGIVVLLFSLGLEFSFKKLLNVGGSARGHGTHHRHRHDGCRIRDRPRARIQPHQQPVSRRHAVDVVHDHHHQSIHRPGITAAQIRIAGYSRCS